VNESEHAKHADEYEPPAVAEVGSVASLTGADDSATVTVDDS
jgi:hypothetical protein